MTRAIRSWAVALGVAGLVTAANGSQGAYFSQSWGWVALALVCPVALALILGVARRPGRFPIAFAVLVAAFGAWVAMSSLWSISPASSMREVERMLVYVALALAVALVLRHGDASALAAGVFAGAALIGSYALATRLFPDRFETYDDPALPYRLAEPVGYWNALGLLAAMGIVMGLGFVAHARRMQHAALAALALPILSTTLYFTFSRGAWAALGLGLAAMLGLDARRLRCIFLVLAVAPVSVVAVAVASQQEALTTEGVRKVDAVTEGHRLAVIIAALALLSGLVTIGATWIARRVSAPRWARRGVDVALAVSVAAGLLIGVLVAGGPRTAITELKDRFDAPLAAETANLNERLFTVSGNGRAQSIGIAWDGARERPLLGHGAGSYEYLWYERRPSLGIVRDAHSLYAETLAELGIVGLALLGLALLVPVVAARKARRSRFVPATIGAYTAWAAHSAMDWHWEIVGVTLVALLACGVALLASERGHVRPLPQAVRWPLLAASVGLTLFALVSLVGNQALFAGREALARSDWQEAAEHGRRAETLLFWSFEPQLVLGDAAAGAGNRQAALDAYREATRAGRRNWVVWLRLAQVARGRERRAAYERVQELNPREPDLPGADE